MKIIDGSLHNGTAVVVGMIMVILFGYLAFTRIPIQLNPTIESPVITVETDYPGASAMEVEQEITIPQEEKLAAVENLREMRSTSSEGHASIALKFDWGVNKDLAGLNVLKKLNIVEKLPDDAEEPQILTVNEQEEETVLWLYLDTEIEVDDQYQIVDDLIKPQLERVKDVGVVRAYGGSEREIQVLVDLAALDARDLTLTEVAAGLARDNRNVRGGSIDRGNTRLIVRTPAQYANLDQIGQTVVANGPSGPVRVRDIGQVVDSHKDKDVIVRVNGHPTIAIGVVKKVGANTLDVAERVKAEMARINEQLAPRNLTIQIAYDASEYIWDSIFQVRGSLILGAILATIVLWFFLRSVVSTLIIGITIPTCMIGTFVLLAAFGRSVNVISLAGLGFASGMIVDNGIVVIENIYRHRTELGKSILRAARDGATEVWAPIVASTLTTLAVFIPILFIEEEAGQLFRDIAFSISFAVFLSMFAAITMVPMFASRLMGRLPAGVKHGNKDKKSAQAAETAETTKTTSPAIGFAPARWLHRVIDPPLFLFARSFHRLFLGIVSQGLRHMWMRLLIIALICGGFVASLALVPPAEYLPTGNQNFIIGLFKLPAGMSLSGSEALMSDMEEQVLALPELEHTFFVMMRNMPIFGVIVDKKQAHKRKMTELVGRLNAFASGHYPFPDIIPIIFQYPVFGHGLSAGKSVKIDLRGPDLRKLEQLSNQMMMQLSAIDGVVSVRPSLDLDNPELQVIPDRERLGDLGLTVSDVAETVETLVEGRITSLYREGSKEYDLKLKARDELIDNPMALSAVMVPTPSGEKVRLIDLARVERRLGPVKVEHLEQDRSVTLEVTLDEATPLERFIDTIKTSIINPQLTKLPFEYTIQLSGSADDLSRTMTALMSSFILALVIIYLLMAALFQSFVYPLVILFSVPLAMTGAFLSIRLTGAEFNVITMLGLILLAGVVVNNAILLVDVSLQLLRAGHSHHGSILEAVRRRIRPIFMTSATSVLGMLPLAMGQGSGAELYQGLGVAVVGGLTISTLFTLILIPLVLAFVVDVRDGIARALGREDWTEAATARKLAEIDEEI